MLIIIIIINIIYLNYYLSRCINFIKEITPNNKFKYTIDFSFPLVKGSFKELIYLEPTPMGVNFYLYMNN